MTTKSSKKSKTAESSLALLDLLTEVESKPIKVKKTTAKAKALKPNEPTSIVHVPQESQALAKTVSQPIESLGVGVIYKPLDYERDWIIALCEPQLHQFTKNMIKRSYSAQGIKVAFK